MKTKGKPWQFFVVAVLIVVFAFTAFLGISTQYGDTTKIWVKGAQDIRFGIDIRGGVDVTFMPADGYDATDEQMAAAESVIQQRLVNLNITDNEVYTDYNKDRIIVRFPWKEGETDFNPESAIQEIGATAVLTFREGKEVDSEGKPTGVTAENIILEGKDIKSATAAVDNNANSATYGQYYVSLELNDSGKESFAEATTRLSESKGTISIWMDDTMISYPTVNSAITDGNAMITLNGSDDKTRDEAISLANKINSGALPFALTAENYSTISPSLGANSLQAMVIAGVVAFVLVALFMIANYRLPGAVAVIALLGQTAMTLAFVSGYFSVLNSFTLTLRHRRRAHQGGDPLRQEHRRRHPRRLRPRPCAGHRRQRHGHHRRGDADGCVWPHRRLFRQDAQADLLCLRPLYGGHDLFLRVYAAGGRAAELCVRRYLHARDAEGHLQAEMHAQPGFVWRGKE